MPSYLQFRLGRRTGSILAALLMLIGGGLATTTVQAGPSLSNDTYSARFRPEQLDPLLPRPEAVKDLQYGVALYEYYQRNYFSALTELKIAAAKGGINNHYEYPRLLEGGIDLAWGLDLSANKIFVELLNQVHLLEPQVRDQAWYYLAKVLYRRQASPMAYQAAIQVGQQLPVSLQPDYLLLLVNLRIATGLEDIAGQSQAVQGGVNHTIRAANMRTAASARKQLIDDVEALIEQFPADSVWRSYARFNLGVALRNTGQPVKAIGEFVRVSRMPAYDNEYLALRDRAGLAAGYVGLQRKLGFQAQQHFERVRLNGPYSNLALLGSGWAMAQVRDYRKALAAWQELAKRPLTDPSTLEAQMTVPFAYEKLEIRGAALRGYQRAQQRYQVALTDLDAALAEVESGAFIDHFLTEQSPDDLGWMNPTIPTVTSSEMVYLYSLVSENSFQQDLHGLQDLISLQRHLSTWRGKMSDYDAMLEVRQQAREQRLSGRDPLTGLKPEQSQFLNLLDQHRVQMIERIDTIEREQDIYAVLDGDLAEQAKRLDQAWAIWEKMWSSPEAAEYGERLQRLQQLLDWQVKEAYPDQLWKVKKNVRSLESVWSETLKRRQAVAGAVGRQADLAPFAARIDAVNQRLEGASTRLDRAIAMHRTDLQQRAVTILQRHKNSIRRYLEQTDLAIVRLYDTKLSEQQQRGSAQ